MSGLRQFVTVLLVSILLVSYALAQEDTAAAHFSVAEASPLVGQPIEFVLTVDVPSGAVVTMPQFPADWPALMVRDVSEITLDSSSGRDVYQQRLTVIFWQTGDYQTPEMEIDYQVAGSDVIRQVQVQPAYFSVESILDPDDLNLRPLKPPISLFYISPWFGISVAVGLAVLGAYGWKTRKRWKTILMSSSRDDSLFPAAKTALDSLKVMDVSKTPSIKLYAKVANALRGYLQGRFDLQAEDMTTEELADVLSNSHHLSQRRQRELVYLLEQADLVKFARFQPQQKSAEKMVSVAQRWILAVEHDHHEEVE